MLFLKLMNAKHQNVINNHQLLMGAGSCAFKYMYMSVCLPIQGRSWNTKVDILGEMEKVFLDSIWVSGQSWKSPVLFGS